MLDCFSGNLSVCKITAPVRLPMNLFVRLKIDNYFRGAGLLALSILISACHNRTNAVSGTIEVDEVHVGPRAPGRVEKIFAQEGDHLHAGQPIVQLDAAELKARRDLFYAGLREHAPDVFSGQPPKGAFYAFVRINPAWTPPSGTRGESLSWTMTEYLSHSPATIKSRTLCSKDSAKRATRTVNHSIASGS